MVLTNRFLYNTCTIQFVHKISMSYLYFAGIYDINLHFFLWNGIGSRERNQELYINRKAAPPGYVKNIKCKFIAKFPSKICSNQFRW